MRTLITGGTGSIGQELVRKLLARTEDTIIVFSRDEQKQELMADRFNSDRLRFFLGDIRDKDRITFALRDVDRVIHAAALKIVPALEYNPFEAVKTNIIGTQNIIEGLINVGCSVGRDSRGFYRAREGFPKLIALSTDKACSPTNLYGATKLCLEKLIIAANNLGNPFKFSVVRYGNVAMSRGSVLPKFQEIMKNAAIMRICTNLPVTDERMTRFWITLDEASDFVLKCLDDMEGGEVFIPKMKSFRVQDVATLMDRRPVAYTGMRPGEKIHETIISEDEGHLAHNDGERYVIKYQDIHHKPDWITVPDSYYKVIDKMLKKYEFKAPVTSANFVMSLDQLREKLESVGIKCNEAKRETINKRGNKSLCGNKEKRKVSNRKATWKNN